MIKVGHDLSDEEIERRYTALTASLNLPGYFYPAVAAFAPLRPGLRVLDVGCGDGQLLAELLRRCPELTCVGTEVASGRLAAALRRVGARALLLQVGGRGFIPLRDGAIDLIVMTEVLEHLKDPAALLRNLRELLSPQGRLVLTAPNSDAYPLWPQMAWLAERAGCYPLVRHFLPFEHPLKTRQPIDTVLSCGEVGALLREAGFRPLRVVGREALPFLFALPGVRGLAHRGIIRRGAVDWVFNRLGLARWCYRTFWECLPDGEAPTSLETTNYLAARKPASEP